MLTDWENRFYFPLTFAVKKRNPVGVLAGNRQGFSPVRYQSSGAGVRLDYSSPAFCQLQMASSPCAPRISLGKVVHRVLQPDSDKLTALIAFKETEQVMERIEALARRQRRKSAFVARAIFRIGLDAVEKAIEGGLLS